VRERRLVHGSRAAILGSNSAAPSWSPGFSHNSAQQSSSASSCSSTRHALSISPCRQRRNGRLSTRPSRALHRNPPAATAQRPTRRPRSGPARSPDHRDPTPAGQDAHGHQDSASPTRPGPPIGPPPARAARSATLPRSDPSPPDHRPGQQLLKLKAAPRAACGRLNQRHRHSTVDLTPVLITRDPPPPVEQAKRPTRRLDRSPRVDQPTRISPPAGRHRVEATQPAATGQTRHGTERSCRHKPRREAECANSESESPGDPSHENRFSSRPAGC
jgi:hypothetical protein